MSDEQFRLTPLDVRRWEFGSALRGYDRVRVDEFKARVADEIEDLMRRINDLDGKARGFHEQLRAFRERDRAINDALVSAQQLRTDIREQAEKEGSLVLQEARAEADRVTSEARFEAEKVAHESRTEADRLSTEARQRADELLREAREEADKLLRDAREEAEFTVREARAEARGLVDDGKASAKRIALELDQLSRARSSYLSQMKALAERHLQDVEAARTTTPTMPAVAERYLHDTDEVTDVVEARIKPRKTPPMNAKVTPRDTIASAEVARALADGVMLPPAGGAADE